MSREIEQLEAGIAALEAQRGQLGDAVVDAMLAPARARLASLGAARAPSGAEPALKQVSILVLHVTGAADLARHQAPGAVGAILDAALARGSAVVEAHQGRVVESAGDRLVAVFGAPEAREDDAERAVFCGLALLGVGRSSVGAVAAGQAAPGVDLRVGIHTGGVLLGGGPEAEGGLRGLAATVAARMEQTAPPGALRISHDTCAMVRGMFELAAPEPVVVKGLETPLTTYRVLRAKPRSFRIGTRGIEGVATKMIGRDAELERLQTAFRQVFEARRLAAFTVVAEAGIGKSRLLYEFESWCDAQPQTFFLFRGRATPQTSTQAFGLLRDILAWRLQIQDDDSLETARRKMEDGLVPLFVHDDGPDLAQAHAHLLGHLIGIDWADSRHVKGILGDPKQIRNRAFHAAAQLLRRVGATDGSPVLLQLEDLHWADHESLDFLNYLVEVSRDLPLLMLAFTRPTLFERRVDWLAAEGLHQRIDLQPLDRRDSRDLANELLKKLPSIPAALRELVTSSAEGNPFYMEEMVKMLIDQGAIRTGDAWAVDAERLLVTKVPSTLTGVLQARLDGLPAAERRALQQASVIGPVFWDQALAALAPDSVTQLPALVQRQLTLPRPDAQLEGVREYAFRHPLLHQVTYETVLEDTRRDGHARVARWLADLADHGGPRSGDVLGQAAEHFERAGDVASAAEFHARAADHAAQRFAHDRVLTHVARGLALLDEAPTPAPAALRWRLLSVRERGLNLQARRDEQAADLRRLAQLAAQEDNPRWHAEVASRRAHLALRRGDRAAQEESARQAMAWAVRAGDDALRLEALRLLADAQIDQGDIEGGSTLALQGLDEARQGGLRAAEAGLLNVLTYAASKRGDVKGGLEWTQQSMLIERELGDRVGVAISAANLGNGWMTLGALAQAQREMDAALQMVRAQGDRHVEAIVLQNLSTLALWQGEDTRALALARQALDIGIATQSRSTEMSAGLWLGHAELALGRLAPARQSCAEALRLATWLGDAEQHHASAALARVALAEGDAAAAAAALKPVLDLVDAGGSLDGTEYPRFIEITCHLALARAGDPRAGEWLRRAHAALMAQADAIGEDPAMPNLRRDFLQNVPFHREIVEAWARAASPSGPAHPESAN
jgi:class 3 adenylate cyclase/tetratricopeptide (TPR) repeat protein